jgi:hypothetical protein
MPLLGCCRMGLAGGKDIENALWLIKTGDIGVGPVSTDEIVAMLESGELTRRTQVQRQGNPEGWQRIDTTPLLVMARLDHSEDSSGNPQAHGDPNEGGWFYGNKYDRKGPATRSEIKAMHEAGSLDPHTLVWRNGMDVWQPLHPGHWLLEDTATDKPKQFSYWEARAKTVAPRESWQPGPYTIALGFFLAFIGYVAFKANQDDNRFQALSLAEQYEERCKYPTAVTVMAAEFIRLHLNLVEAPKFEQWNAQRAVSEKRNAANDCVFTVEDHIIFKNENGGQTRRHARVVVTPTRGSDKNRWSLLSIDVR